MMILIGPILMFGGLILTAWCADHFGPPAREDAALEEYSIESWEREQAESEPDIDPYALERLGQVLEGVER